MMQSDTIGEIAKAIAAAQAELTNPVKKKTAKLQKKDGSPSYSYQYADIAEVLDTVRPVYSKHGVAITQPTVLAENVLIVRTQLSHSSGEWMASDYPVCSLNGDHKAMGAAMTYARRYALSSIAGVAADDDTDGEGASEVDAPKRKSSAALKRENVWPKLEHELSECESVVGVDRLQRDYMANEFRTWSTAFREQAEELFDKRRHELNHAELKEQLEGSLEEAKAVLDPKISAMIQSRAEYLGYCRDMAHSFTDRAEARTWWNEQAPARKRFRLTGDEESEISTLIKASLEKPTTTFVPNARARAGILDGQNNPMPPRDQSGN